MIEWWKDSDWFERSVIGALGLVVAAMPLLIWGVILAEQDWVRWRTEHHCRITEKMPGSSAFTSKGEYVYVPGKTAWLCDDGIIHWRQS